jgi:cell division septum initiation protein DivIVA
MKDEIELDLMVAELEHENKQLKDENEQLRQALAGASAANSRLQDALERILAVSRMALWGSGPEGVSQMGAQAREKTRNAG